MGGTHVFYGDAYPDKRPAQRKGAPPEGCQKAAIASGLAGWTDARPQLGLRLWMQRF